MESNYKNAHDFYFTQVCNYSSKSIQIIFGFKNKDGIQKESNVWWIPKKFVKAIDFNNGIITISHFFLKVNGWVWRYQVNKAYKRPDKVNIWLDSFYGDSNLNSGYLGTIKLIWTQNKYDRVDYCFICKQSFVDSYCYFSENIKCKICRKEREFYLLEKHNMGF